MNGEGSKGTRKSSQRVIEVLSSEECDAIRAVIEKAGGPVRLLIYLMMEAGLRAGECRKLRWENVTLGTSPLQVINLTSDVTKTGQPRQVPMNSTITRALKEIIRIWEQFKKSPSPSDWLFPSPSKEAPITVRAIEKQVSWVGMAALGRHIRPHVLRHTFADQLRRVTDIRTVQHLLGHSSLTSTQIYTHPNSDDSKKAIAAAFDKRTTGRGIVPE